MILSGFLVFISLLAVLKAPAKPLWFVAIGVTEWGHFLALASGALAWYYRVSKGRWTPGGWLALAASMLYISPLVRALPVARALPAELTTRFGPAVPREYSGATPRNTPLDLIQLFSGIPPGRARESTHTYSTQGDHPLMLDLYQPLLQDTGLLPGVLVVHSGSWQSGDRHEFVKLNRYLASRGYIVAALDYRLAPQFIAPAQQSDVLAAIRYLKEHALVLGLDAQRLVLLGRSAGGQVALAAAYAQYDPAIKGVIAFYAPNDLVWGYSIPCNPLMMNCQQVIETYLGGKPRTGVYEAASPLLFVNNRTPPTLMIHGGRDELVSPLHEERLSKKLAEAGRPHFYLRMPWATHGCDANFSGPCGQLSTYAVERFLAAVMNRSS